VFPTCIFLTLKTRLTMLKYNNCRYNSQSLCQRRKQRLILWSKWSDLCVAYKMYYIHVHVSQPTSTPRVLKMSPTSTRRVSGSWDVPQPLYCSRRGLIE
jgi:hypothetical protein